MCVRLADMRNWWPAIYHPLCCPAQEVPSKPFIYDCHLLLTAET